MYILQDGFLSATIGFMTSLFNDHHAEKERFWRNGKNSEDIIEKR